MRVIKWGVAGLLGVVLLAVAVLFAMGRREGAGRNDYTLEIARPPDVVYAWISDPPKLKQWVTWLVDVRRDPPGPDGVVRREVWVMDDPNTKSRMELETTMMRAEPPRLVEATVSVPGTFNGTVSYTLEPVGASRTRLSYRSHFSYAGWFFQLLEPLVTPEAQKKLVSDLETLRRLAEAEPVR